MEDGIVTKRTKINAVIAIVTTFTALSLVTFICLCAIQLFVNDPKIVAAINELSDYCTDKTYVLYDLEGTNCQPSFNERISFKNLSFDNRNDVGKYVFCDGLLNTNNGFYFLIREWPPNKYHICKTLDYEHCSIVGSFDENYQFNVSGFDNYGYFVTKDSVYEFDFSSGIMNCLDNKDEWCLFLLNNNPKTCQKKYMEKLNIERSRCKRSMNNVSLNYLGDVISINENEISDVAFSKVVNEHHFYPDFHISYPSGLTSIFYRKDSFFSRELHLVINYNRDTKKIIGYQMFDLLLVSSDMLIYLPAV